MSNRKNILENGANLDKNFRIEPPELTKEEKEESEYLEQIDIQKQQLSTLKTISATLITIKNCVIFFTVLTVLWLIGAMILIILLL